MVIYVPMVLPILVTLLVKDLIMLLGGADLIKKKTHSAFCKLVRKGRNNYFLLFRMSYRISQGIFAYENMVLDLILLSVTAASMLYALYRYGKILFCND